MSGHLRDVGLSCQLSKITASCGVTTTLRAFCRPAPVYCESKLRELDWKRLG